MLIKNLFNHLKILLTLIVCFFSFAYTQDVIKIDGKEIKGKYVSVDFKTNRFTFIYDGRDTPVELPIDNNRLDFIRLQNGKYIFKNPKIIAAEKELIAQEEKRKANLLAEEEKKKADKEKARRKREIEEKCSERSAIKIATVPFVNDYYAATDWVSDTLKSICFNVDKPMISVLEWFQRKDINLKDITDYNLYIAQKELGIDRLLYGFVNKKEELIQGAVSKDWVYLTVFYIDSKSGNREYMWKNERVFWY